MFTMPPPSRCTVYLKSVLDYEKMSSYILQLIGEVRGTSHQTLHTVLVKTRKWFISSDVLILSNCPLSTADFCCPQNETICGKAEEVAW